MKRQIVTIDEERCTGCGQCVPNCHEGALQIVDGKARLTSDFSCDGLGACIGHCPEGAITIETREADAYDERKAVESVVPQGPNVVAESMPSGLRQWPVQLMLVSPRAPFLAGADILIAADCVPFAYERFHEKLLKGKALLVGCPKLDDAELYREKLTEMFRHNDVKSVTVAHMEVPCCFGMVRLVEEAIRNSGKDIPLTTRMIDVKGEEL